MQELKREGIKGPNVVYADNSEQIGVLLASANLFYSLSHVVWLVRLSKASRHEWCG
jgi:hypothetical protein